MIRLLILIYLFALLHTGSLLAQLEPCDPPLIAAISASGPVCAGGTVFITFNLPNDDDDDEEGFDVSYSIGGNSFTLQTIFNGHTVGHVVTASTTVTLTAVIENGDDDDDACFTLFNQTISIAVSSPNLNITGQNNPGCGQNNGSITASASGGTSPYQYSLNGGAFQNNATFGGLGAGNYTLVARDAAGCISLAAAATLVDPGANLPAANLNANTTQGCSNTIFTLTGNLPPGTTGLWSSAEIQPPAPANPVWTPGNISPGSVTVTWTLSAPGCPNYDAASLTLDVLAPPQANPDGAFTVEQGGDATVEVLLNDVTSAPVGLRILKNPVQGTAFVTSQNTLEYQPNATANGVDTVIYEICYLECPDACDTALVLFRNVRNDDPCVITGDTSNVFTNGLTPNGDGRNDHLFFRAVSVEDCAINYAKSDIIIYNRWGDVVYEASPYNNDWGGTNRNGNDLPPGVYYFVLRITLDEVYSQFGSVILIR